MRYTNYMIRTRPNELNGLKRGDILMYDEEHDYFYKTTAKEFFYKYEAKLEELLKRYDEKVLKMTNELEEEKKRNLEFTNEIKEMVNNHLEANKVTMNKLIEIVENFTKENK